MQFLKTLLCVGKALTVNNGFRNRQENKGFNKKFFNKSKFRFYFHFYCLIWRQWYI